MVVANDPDENNPCCVLLRTSSGALFWEGLRITVDDSDWMVEVIKVSDDAGGNSRTFFLCC